MCLHTFDRIVLLINHGFYKAAHNRLFNNMVRSVAFSVPLPSNINVSISAPPRFVWSR